MFASWNITSSIGITDPGEDTRASNPKDFGCGVGGILRREPVVIIDDFPSR